MRHATVFALTLLLARGAAAATPCPPDTFDPQVATTSQYPLFGDTSPSGAFAVGADTISMGPCGSTTLRVRARRHYTFLHARWPDCPGFGPVRYQGITNYPPCTALVSILRWREPGTGRRRALKFESLRQAE